MATGKGGSTGRTVTAAAELDARTISRVEIIKELQQDGLLSTRVIGAEVTDQDIQDALNELADRRLLGLADNATDKQVGSEVDALKERFLREGLHVDPATLNPLGKAVVLSQLRDHTGTSSAGFNALLHDLQHGQVDRFFLPNTKLDGGVGPADDPNGKDDDPDGKNLGGNANDIFDKHPPTDDGSGGSSGDGSSTAPGPGSSGGSGDGGSSGDGGGSGSPQGSGGDGGTGPAPGDGTPAPGDGTPAPGGGTPAPGGDSGGGGGGSSAGGGSTPSDGGTTPSPAPSSSDTGSGGGTGAGGGDPGGGGGEVVHVVSEVSTGVIDADPSSDGFNEGPLTTFYESDDGRWFDEGGNEVTDPKDIAALNEEQAKEQSGVDTPATSDEELQTSGRTHDEAVGNTPPATDPAPSTDSETAPPDSSGDDPASDPSQDPAPADPNNQAPPPDPSSDLNQPLAGDGSGGGGDAGGGAASESDGGGVGAQSGDPGDPGRGEDGGGTPNLDKLGGPLVAPTIHAHFGPTDGGASDPTDDDPNNQFGSGVTVTANVGQTHGTLLGGDTFGAEVTPAHPSGPLPTQHDPGNIDPSPDADSNPQFTGPSERSVAEPTPSAGNVPHGSHPTTTTDTSTTDTSGVPLHDHLTPVHNPALDAVPDHLPIADDPLHSGPIEPHHVFEEPAPPPEDHAFEPHHPIEEPIHHPDDNPFDDD